MIEIGNRELFYSTPMIPPKLTRRADINLVYKTLNETEDGVTTTEMKQITEEIYLTELSTQFIGHALKKLGAWGYVENRPENMGHFYKSHYYKTSAYYREWDHGGVNKPYRVKPSSCMNKRCEYLVKSHKHHYRCLHPDIPPKHNHKHLQGVVLYHLDVCPCEGNP